MIWVLDTVLTMSLETHQLHDSCHNSLQKQQMDEAHYINDQKLLENNTQILEGLYQ